MYEIIKILADLEIPIYLFLFQYSWGAQTCYSGVVTRCYKMHKVNSVQTANNKDLPHCEICAFWEEVAPPCGKTCYFWKRRGRARWNVQPKRLQPDNRKGETGTGNNCKPLETWLRGVGKEQPEGKGKIERTQWTELCHAIAWWPTDLKFCCFVFLGVFACGNLFSWSHGCL